MTLYFTVVGTPVAQGSMSAFIIGRRQGDGSVANARAVVTATNKGKLNPWRSVVQAAAEEACGGVAPVDVPVAVDLTFVVERPRSVQRAYPSTKPDIDKLARAVLDALTGAAFVDDSRVVDLACRKRYTSGTNDRPGVHVIVTQL